MKSKRTARPSGPVYPIQFETFRSIGGWEVSRLKQDEPSCFNGGVSVRKYRVTIELVDEPAEAIRARIQALWDKCDNPHHWGPLHAAAAKYGLTLRHRY